MRFKIKLKNIIELASQKIKYPNG